jgi:hypothetical protein
MAQLVALNIYQINSLDPFPLASVPRIAFPFAGIMVRAINGGAGALLTTGTVVYSQLQLIATGATYSAIETVAAIQALS